MSDERQPRFYRHNKSEIVARDCLTVEVRHFADGTMESQVRCLEDGKWRSVSTTYMAEDPSWDLLHKCHYIGRGERCFTPPAPIEAVIVHMKYVAHCLEIRKQDAGD